MKGIKIQISNLANGTHKYNFELGSDFFNHYNWDNIYPQVVSKSVNVKLCMMKEEHVIKIDYSLCFFCQMICDRTAVPFDETLKVKDYLIIKYDKTSHNIPSHNIQEDTDNHMIDERVMLIQERAQYLDLSKYFFESLVLIIPMKKILPSIKKEETHLHEGNKFIYSTQRKQEKNDENEHLENLLNSPFSLLKQIIKK